MAYLLNIPPYSSGMQLNIGLRFTLTFGRRSNIFFLSWRYCYLLWTSVFSFRDLFVPLLPLLFFFSTDFIQVLLFSMSILISSTIKAASSTHIHHTQHKSAPLTLKQKKEKQIQREENQAAIDTAVDEWFNLTMEKANELGEKFNKKPRYFLDIFFHGGARMVHHHEKVNPHNAFISLKSQELRDGTHSSYTVTIFKILFIDFLRRRAYVSRQYSTRVQGRI